jgi:hypothetical protein
MLLDDGTVQKGIGTTDPSSYAPDPIAQLRLTEAEFNKLLDEAFDECLAYEKEHSTIDVPPTLLPEGYTP